MSTVASRFEEIDASIRLRASASICRCTTGCSELRMKKIQIRFQKPIGYAVSVYRKTDARPGHIAEPELDSGSVRDFELELVLAHAGEPGYAEGAAVQ